MTPKTVLVTGASSGIGLDVCRALGERGFRAFGTVRRAEDASRVAASGATALSMDVTDAPSVVAARDELVRLLDEPSLYGLVNNAGISGAGAIELLDLDEFRRMFEVNVLGAVTVTKTFLGLLKNGRGRIVNISSVSGRIAPPFMAPYAASKFALEAISDSLRRELHPFDIDVTVIEPGTIQTPIWEKGAALDLSPALGTPYETILTRMREHAASIDHRALQPADVSRAVLSALTSRKPRTRIPVVRNRLLHALGLLLPDRVMDRRIARYTWDAIEK